MSNKSKQLTDVIEYSKAMLSDAVEGNWEEVIATESTRNNILNSLFSHPFTQKDQEENREKIAQILSINKDLESVTAQARENIKKEISTIGKGRNAIGAYAQNTG